MKIIHTADIHLDSSMKTHLSSTNANIRNNEILNTFYRLTQHAKENNVKVILIAGDLFDEEYISKRTLSSLFSFMKETPNIDYLYVPGNHDEKANDLLENIPNNFIVFKKKWDTYVYEDVAISSHILSEDMYKDIPIIKDKKHIVMIHGQVSNPSGEDYINLNLLKNKNIDYLALGHIHEYSVNKLDFNSIYAYPGCLEGRGFDECGEKGFILLDTDDFAYSFIPFACRTLHQIKIDITGLTNNQQILSKIKDYKIPRKDMTEFILVGTKNFETSLSISYLEHELQDDFFFVKIKNQTKLYIDSTICQNDISLKGEFIRNVLEDNLNDEDSESIIQIGLEALSGEELSI